MLLPWCISLVVGAVVGQTTPPPSPCPDVFRYEFDNGQWLGHITVPFRDTEEVKVVVSLFIDGAIPPDSSGGLRPNYNENVAAERAGIIDYHLIFPVQSPLPAVDKITVNRRRVCIGPPVDARILTRVSFSHQLRMAPLHGRRYKGRLGEIERQSFDMFLQRVGVDVPNRGAFPPGGIYFPEDYGEDLDNTVFNDLHEGNIKHPVKGIFNPADNEIISNSVDDADAPNIKGSSGTNVASPSEMPGLPGNKPNVTETVVDIQMEPRRVVVPYGDDVTLLLNAGTSLRICSFYLPGPSQRFVDFKRGPKSPSNDQYEYFGNGLEVGDCGVKLKNVDGSMDGIVECKIKTVSRGPERSYASAVRVTDLPPEALPAFEIIPKQATVEIDGDITITCNARRSLDICSFILYSAYGISKPQVLNFDYGPNSESTDTFRYYGEGLKHGECGVTLLAVRSNVTGFIACKLGWLPDEADADEEVYWNLDVMKITVISSQRGRELTSIKGASGVVSQNLQCLPCSMQAEVSCGRSLLPSPSIFGGMPTKQGDWPWLAALYSTRNEKFLCGSTLISMSRVITAAHCTYHPESNKKLKEKDLYVSLGKFNRSKFAERGNQLREVQTILRHTSYNSNPTSLANDIAILVLDDDVDYSPYVRPICLWDSTKTSLQQVVNREATVVGWGITENKVSSSIPLLATVTIVSQEQCRQSHETFQDLVTDKTFCASNMTGVGPCYGDSGGGLFLQRQHSNKSTSWYLRGIVSFNVPGNLSICNLDGYSLFTDVAQYLGWIEKAMIVP